MLQEGNVRNDNTKHIYNSTKHLRHIDAVIGPFVPLATVPLSRGLRVTRCSMHMRKRSMCTALNIKHSNKDSFPLRSAVIGRSP